MSQTVTTGYQRLTMPVLVDVLQAHGVDLSDMRMILDIGAMDGGDAAELQRLFPRAEVCAIEGLRENYTTYLQYRRDIRCFHAVIGARDGTVEFFEKEWQGLHGMYERICPPATVGKCMERCYRLDTFLRLNNITQPDLMKIDVEGATYDVLIGSGQALDAVRVLQIEAETKEWFRGQVLEDRIVAFLESRSFRRVFRMQCCEGQYDSVFLNSRFYSSDASMPPL